MIIYRQIKRGDKKMKLERNNVMEEMLNTGKNYTWIGVQYYRGRNFMTAYGDDYEEVEEIALMYWRIRMNYDGHYKVVKASEIF